MEHPRIKEILLVGEKINIMRPSCIKKWILREQDDKTKCYRGEDIPHT